MRCCFAKTKQILRAGIRSGKTILLIGSPGVGKSALVAEVAAELDLPLHTLIGSHCDPTDIAGFPFVVKATLTRALLKTIKACVDAPGILFLDEASGTPAPVQAALMRLTLERIAGDTPLHEGSVVVLAANRPEECPNGTYFSAAQVNRVITVEVAPTVDEVAAYFQARVGAPGSTLALEAQDLAATLAVDPSLLQLEPPQASLDTGAPFASARAWERTLAVIADYIDHEGGDDEGVFAIAAGGVGEEMAVAWRSYRLIRRHLPTVDQIVADPTAAPLPGEMMISVTGADGSTKTVDARDAQIATMGLLPRVAARDPWAAWAYVGRLDETFKACGGRILQSHPVANANGQWRVAGARAQAAIVAGLARIVA